MDIGQSDSINIYIEQVEPPKMEISSPEPIAINVEGGGVRGEKGDKGDKGDTGNTGPQGDKGDTGATGATGPIGPQGPQGEQGPIGPAGPAGAGSGDVIGPSSATSGNLATFDGTTGKYIKDSGTKISDYYTASEVDTELASKSDKTDTVTDITVSDVKPGASGTAIEINKTKNGTTTTYNIPFCEKIDDVHYSGIMTGTQGNKLDAIEEQATKNDTDAQLRDRTTHTGEQAISTVTGLQGALDGKQPNIEVGAYSVPYRNASSSGLVNSSLQPISSSAMADTLAQRNSSGQLVINAPTASDHAVNRGYLKALATKDKATASDIDWTTMPHPIATSTPDGKWTLLFRTTSISISAWGMAVFSVIDTSVNGPYNMKFATYRINWAKSYDYLGFNKIAGDDLDSGKIIAIVDDDNHLFVWGRATISWRALVLADITVITVHGGGIVPISFPNTIQSSEPTGAYKIYIPNMPST